MYKYKVEEHKGKKDFVEIEYISEGEVLRVEGNEML